MPLLQTVPGIAWVLGLHDRCRDRRHRPLPVARRSWPATPASAPRLPVRRERPPRPAGKERPQYLRWALIEATTHACKHPAYRDRYQRTKHRLGKQRGPKVAQVDLARRLAEAIWHMLTRNQPFAPAGAPAPLAA